MSAYDNPTIIRDDSAVILGQGIASFGENFTKAMNEQLAIAAEERKYEAKLRKETEERQIATQTAAIKQANANMKEVASAVDTVKEGDPFFTNKFGEIFSSVLEIDGKNDTKASLSTVPAEEITANNKYKKAVAQFKEKSISTFAAMKSNIDTGKAMGPRDWQNTDWMGDTRLAQKVSEISYYASDPDNYNYRDKVIKDYYIEDGDPSKPVIEIITKVDAKEDAKDPSKIILGDSIFSKKEIDEEIAKGKDGSVIYDEATKEYSLRFKQKLGSSTWDGTFFHKIADAPDSDKIWGKTQGDVLDSKTNELKTSFIMNPGSPVITKEKIKDFPNKEKQVETIYLNMPALNGVLNSYYNAGSQALLNADLKDPTQLKSFLQNKLYRGNETLEEFFKANPTPKAQEEFFAKKLLEIDTETKLGKTYNRRVAKQEDVDAKRASAVGDWVYYSRTEKVVPTAKAEQSEGDNKKISTAFFTEAEIEGYQQRYKDLVDGKIEKIELPQKGKGMKIFIFNPTTGRVEQINSKEEVLDTRVDTKKFREYLGIKPETKKVKPKLKG